MKFTKANQELIIKLWRQGAQLKEIAKELNAHGATTSGGLPIKNQHVSLFCLSKGMRRQKNKKNAYKKIKKIKMRLEEKNKSLKAQKITEPDVAPITLDGNAFDIAHPALVILVANSRHLSDAIKIKVIKDLLM